MIEKGDHIIITGLGLEFALIMCSGYFGGRWLDGRFGSSPLLLLTGCALAFGLGIYILIKTANTLAKREDAGAKAPAKQKNDN